MHFKVLDYTRDCVARSDTLDCPAPVLLTTSLCNLFPFAFFSVTLCSCIRAWVLFLRVSHFVLELPDP